MNTNNQALCNTSWGRICLMLKADLIGTKSTLMLLYSSLLAVLIFIPRIPLLFGTDYMGWAIDWANTYTLPFVAGILNLVTGLYIFVYINKRTQHQQPMIFSTLPMALWEKFVAMNLYFVVVELLALLTVLVDFGIECLTVPSIHFADITQAFDFIYLFSNPLDIDWGGSPGKIVATLFFLLNGILINLFSYFLLWFNATKIRNAFLGMVAMWFEIMGITLISALLFTFFGLPIVLAHTPSSDTLDSWAWGLMIVITIYAAAWTYAAGRLLYKRLKNIES